jgi:hypothetical protein
MDVVRAALEAPDGVPVRFASAPNGGALRIRLWAGARALTLELPGALVEDSGVDIWPLVVLAVKHGRGVPGAVADDTW